MTENII